MLQWKALERQARDSMCKCISSSRRNDKLWNAEANGLDQPGCWHGRTFFFATNRGTARLLQQYSSIFLACFTSFEDFVMRVVTFKWKLLENTIKKSDFSNFYGGPTNSDPIIQMKIILYMKCLCSDQPAVAYSQCAQDTLLLEPVIPPWCC